MKIGERIDFLRTLKLQIDEVNKELSKLKETKASLEYELMGVMDEDAIGKAAGRLATASITERIVPTIDDWDTFYDFIKENNAFYLLERRPAAVAYREMLEDISEIPGTTPFTKRTLNLRKI